MCDGDSRCTLAGYNQQNALDSECHLYNFMVQSQTGNELDQLYLKVCEGTFAMIKILEDYQYSFVRQKNTTCNFP